MSIFRKPDQNWTFAIPSDGQLFLARGDTGRGVPGQLNIRKGNRVFAIDVQKYGQTYFDSLLQPLLSKYGLQRNHRFSQYDKSVRYATTKRQKNLAKDLRSLQNKVGYNIFTGWNNSNQTGQIQLNGWDAMVVAKKQLKTQGIDLNGLPRYNLGDLSTVFKTQRIKDISQFQNKVIKNPNEVITSKRSTTNPYANDVTSNITGSISKAPAPSALARQAQTQGLQTQMPKDLTTVRAPVTPTFDINKFNQAIASNNIAEVRRLGGLPAATGIPAIDTSTAVATKAAKVAGLPAFKPGATVQNGVVKPTPSGIKAVQQVTQAPVGSPQTSKDVLQASTATATQAANVAGLPAFQPGAVNTPAGIQPTQIGQQLLNDRLAQAVKAERPKQTGNINASSIQNPPQSISLPKQTITPVPSTADLTTLVQQNKDLFKSNQDQQNAVNADALKLAQLTGQAGTQNQFRAQQQQSQGFDAKQQRIQDLNNKLDLLNTQQQQAKNTAQNRLAPTFAIAGEQAAIDRATAIKKFGVASELKAAQGDMRLALDFVDRAVTAKFEPLQAQINAQKIILNNAQDALRRGDVKNTNAVKMALSERSRLLAQRERDLAIQRSNEKDKRILSIQAIQNGAPDLLVQQIQDAQSVDQAVQLAGQYLKTPNKPVQPKDFTLSSGQKRYDSQGNLIASSAPKASTTKTTKVYSGTTLPGDLRAQVIKTIKTANNGQTQITPDQLSTQFPNINFQTINALYNEYNKQKSGKGFFNSVGSFLSSLVS